MEVSRAPSARKTSLGARDLLGWRLTVSYRVTSLIDWGTPRAPEWAGPRERLVALVPAEVAWALRERARVEGLALSVLVGRLLANALDIPYAEHIGAREPWPAGVDALIG
jgi:hypothetical protein